VAPNDVKRAVEVANEAVVKSYRIDPDQLPLVLNGRVSQILEENQRLRQELARGHGAPACLDSRGQPGAARPTRTAATRSSPWYLLESTVSNYDWTELDEYVADRAGHGLHMGLGFNTVDYSPLLLRPCGRQPVLGRR